MKYGDLPTDKYCQGEIPDGAKRVTACLAINPHQAQKPCDGSQQEDAGGKKSEDELLKGESEI